MKEGQWIVQNDSRSFSTAEENMRYDDKLLQSLYPNQRMIREYRWQHPGITFSYKQQCPEYLNPFDVSKRVTGGGIVFHSPGDIVFSVIGWRSDPIFNGSLKQILVTISNHIRESLADAGIHVDTGPSYTAVNHQFCTQYPTPFELAVNGEKICGLTIRRLKDRWLVQGIVHLQKTHVSFNSVTKHEHRLTGNICFDGMLLRTLFSRDLKR